MQLSLGLMKVFYGTWFEKTSGLALDSAAGGREVGEAAGTGSGELRTGGDWAGVFPVPPRVDRDEH